MLKQIFY